MLTSQLTHNGGDETNWETVYVHMEISQGNPHMTIMY
jgi:hypothetical protein